MAKKALTPAEREEERKKQEAAWWQKVITYYLNLMYHREVDQEVAKYAPDPLIVSMAQYIQEKRSLRKLMESEPGRMSAMEALVMLSAFEGEESSSFKTLLKEIKENPQDEAKIAESIDRCAKEAPKQIIRREQERSERRKKELEEKKEEPKDPEARREAEQRDRRRAERDARDNLQLNYEMTVLQAIMKPEEYRDLKQTLEKMDRKIDPMQTFLAVAARLQEHSGLSYEEYTAMHKADPVEKGGKLANMDQLVTSAAYMLAAYEQKDEPEFDEKMADLRAMELSGSKGFRAYVSSHPGSLLAAARNTGVEATHREMTALEASLRKRDRVLTSVRDAMRRSATGQTASYHQVMNAIDRFVLSADDPPEQERNALSMKLAQYVMTEGNPSSPHYKKENCELAARALKSLLPKKDFDAFLLTANEGRAPGQKLRSEALSGPVPREAEAPERQGPVLERNEQWN